MDLPDLNFTPPAEDVDEMDEDAENEMEGHVGEEMEGDTGTIVFVAGVSRFSFRLLSVGHKI